MIFGICFPPLTMKIYSFTDIWSETKIIFFERDKECREKDVNELEDKISRLMDKMK